jgi:methionine synthase II (cobalamin-independent)
VVKAINLRVGTASAIGSLPHRQVDAAVSVAMAACPDLPAAPSLPRLDRREGMIAQGAWGLRGVDVDADGHHHLTGALDPADPFGDGGAGVDGPSFGGLRAFLAANRHRTGAVKLQVTGPVTLGLALVRAGAPADRAFAVAGAAVRLRAEAVLLEAIRVAPLAPKVVFVDEPGLVALQSADFPLAPDAAIDLVSSALAAIEPHAVTGLHCCGDTDWRLALAAGPQIVSLPTDERVVDHAGALGVHLDRGGWVAWGAIPTSRPVGTTPGLMWRALSDTWCELVQRGCDALRLREQALVTPECGLAGHDPVQAETILALSVELAERVRRQSFGVRLSVGA